MLRDQQLQQQQHRQLEPPGVAVEWRGDSSEATKMEEQATTVSVEDLSKMSILELNEKLDQLPSHLKARIITYRAVLRIQIMWYVFRFDMGFVTTILLNSTIHSTDLINLSIFMHYPSSISLFIQMRAAAKQAQPISAPDAMLFFSLHVREQNGGAIKVLNPSIRSIEGV